MTDAAANGQGGTEVKESGALVPSSAKTVTLYEDRGEVVRTFAVQLTRGLNRIRVEGITPFVDDRSLSVVGRGTSARVLSTKVIRGVEHVPPEKIAEMESVAREYARQSVDDARGGFLAREDCLRLSRLYMSLARALAAVPPSNELDQWMSSLAEAGQALDSAETRRAECSWRAQDSRRRMQLAKEALSRVRREKPEFHAILEVQVEADADEARAEFEICYRTPCALWRPEYTVRLWEAEAGQPQGQGTMEVSRRAAVWQLTGESWKDVRMLFSTARPAHQAKAPMISDDVLSLRKKTPEEIKNVVVEARDQKIHSVGKGAAGASELPGVDDGGEVRCFEAPGPCTIPSDGAAHHVDLAVQKLPASVSLTACPELSQGVFLKAEARLEGTMPLLAGPVQLARGSGFVGRSSVSYVAAGDMLVLGFGTDDALRVRRSVTERKQAATLTSRQRITRRADICLSNLSGTPKSFVVEERIPVSEIDDVKVSLESAEGFGKPDSDGRLKASVSLPANGTLKLQIVYEVSAADKVTLQI